MVILERRSQAGKVLYRSVSGGWNGSEEDKYRLHEQLELLQKDPTYLSSDATLPELNNEMAPVSHRRRTLTFVLGLLGSGAATTDGKSEDENLNWKNFCVNVIVFCPVRCSLSSG